MKRTCCRASDCALHGLLVQSEGETAQIENFTFQEHGECGVLADRKAQAWLP